MCSILGIYNLDKNKNEFDEKFIHDGFKLMEHRGPDNKSFNIIDSKMLFAHQRLSILDIDSRSDQPMKYDDSWITFNGEIYNFKFLQNKYLSGDKMKTTSDTEVLIRKKKKKGLNILNELNGMFAFGYYKNKNFYLVRDRFGVKPLYYYLAEGALYFSSEIKPILEIIKKKDLNNEYVNNYIKHTATDYDHSTFLKDIYQLKKGNYLKIVNGEHKPIQWYFGNDFHFDSNILISNKKTIDFVENLICDAIKVRLISDVPICLTLSGGIDSAVIYTLLKERLNKKIKIFTYSHRGSKSNEYHKVKKLVSYYNDKIYEVEDEEKRLNINNLEDNIRTLEFPIWGIDSIAYGSVYKEIKKQNFKVVIEGHGSDEQLAGYPFMMEGAFYDNLKNFKFIKAISVLKLINSTNHDSIKKENIFYIFLKLLLKPIFRINQPISLRGLIDWTFNFKILPIVLRAFDRLTMKESIENRAPFMDYRLVELFKKLPNNLIINEIGNKSVLREILKKYKKEFIYEDKRKMGFSMDAEKILLNEKFKKDSSEVIEKYNLHQFFLKGKFVFPKKTNKLDQFNKIIQLSLLNKIFNLDD